MSKVIELGERIARRIRSSGTPGQQLIIFSRQELTQLLQVYAGRVAIGEWRDYAISHDRRSATFSVFRGANEQPLYAVEKRRREANGRHGGFILYEGGHILRRSADLSDILSAVRRPRLHLVRRGSAQQGTAYSAWAV